MIRVSCEIYLSYGRLATFYKYIVRVSCHFCEFRCREKFSLLRSGPIVSKWFSKISEKIYTLPLFFFFIFASLTSVS